MSALGATVGENRPRSRTTVRIVVARALALLSLATVMLQCDIDLLPGQPIVWVLTPTRLAVIIGLLAVQATGEARWLTILDIPLAVLIGSAAVANLVARQEWASWRGLVTVVAVYYLAIGVRRVVPDSWPAIVLLALLCVTLTSAVAVQQVVQGVPTGFCRGAIDGSNDICGPDAMIRATGTFSNPNLLAAYLLLLLPIAAAGLTRADISGLLVRAGLVVMGYAAVVLTGSRGGVLAALASLAVFVFLRRLQPGKHATAERPARWLVPVGGVVAVGALLVALATRGGEVGVRGNVWSAGVRIMAHHPLGVGPGRAGVYLSAAVPGPEVYQHAHNLWLNYGIEDGVIGLCAVAAISVIGLWAAVSATRAGSVTAAATATALSGFVFMSLADHPANNQRIAYAMAAVLAMLVVARERREPAQPITRPRRLVASMFDTTATIPRIDAREPLRPRVTPPGGSAGRRDGGPGRRRAH